MSTQLPVAFNAKSRKESLAHGYFLDPQASSQKCEICGMQKVAWE